VKTETLLCAAFTCLFIIKPDLIKACIILQFYLKSLNLLKVDLAHVDDDDKRDVHIITNNRPILPRDAMHKRDLCRRVVTITFVFCPPLSLRLASPFPVTPQAY